MTDSFNALRLDKVHVYRDIATVSFLNATVTFVPFTDRKQLMLDDIDSATKSITALIKAEFEAVKSLKVPSLLVGHLALKGSIYVGGEIDELSNEIFCPLEAFADYDHVIMGHVHEFQVLNESAPHLSHLGSLDRTAFGESAKQMAYYEVVSETGKVNLEYIPLPGRSLVHMEISVPAAVKDATDYTINEIMNYKAKYKLHDAIVRIKIKLNSHDTDTVDKEKIVDKLTSYGVFHISSFQESRDVDRVLVKNADIDETIDHFKGVDIFMKTIDAEDKYKQMCSDICKSIIKKYQIGCATAANAAANAVSSAPKTKSTSSRKSHKS